MEQEEKDLTDLFEERERVYHQYTEEIADKIGFVFEAVIEFLNVNPLTISWESIEIYNNMLVLMARIQNDDNEQEMRILTIGIPFQMITSGSKENIITFLTTNSNNKEVTSGFRITDNGQLEIDDDELDESTEMIEQSTRFLAPYSKRTLH